MANSPLLGGRVEVTCGCDLKHLHRATRQHSRRVGGRVGGDGHRWVPRVLKVLGVLRALGVLRSFLKAEVCLYDEVYPRMKSNL
mgnify:CR=1 FL=1